jgi:DNA polymerase-3 subunit delta'
MDGRFRVSIIKKAETMTAEAANAFLKTLEEPPGENLIILIATEPQALLPTIVSRCQKVLFRPIPPNLIEGWLVEKRAVEREQAQVLSMLSAGSLGEAVRMLESEFLEKRQQNLLRLIQLAGLSKVQALEMAVECAHEEKKKGDRYSEMGDRGILDLFNVWQTWYRDLLVIKVGGAEGLLMNQDFSNKLKKTAGSFTIEALMESLQILEKAQRDLFESHNLGLTIENSVLALKRLHGCKE